MPPAEHAHADQTDAEQTSSVRSGSEPPLPTPSTIPWPPLLLIMAAAAGVGLHWTWPLPWPGQDDLAARLIGYGIGLAGVALALWSLLALMRAGTTVRPDRGSSVLVTDGPYRRYRNPIYVADVLLLLGAAQLSHNIWLVILAPVFAAGVTWLAILPEERHLEATFGDHYRDYMARSRRWI